MRPKRLLLLAALGLALAAASPAGAQDEPIAFGDARKGPLRVVSFAGVGARFADLTGTWYNDKVGCEQWRRLRVSVFVDFEPPKGRGKIVERTRTGVVKNCAELGPSFGFLLRPRRIGLACPNGRWRPGHYTFHTKTLHLGARLESATTLLWANTRAC